LVVDLSRKEGIVVKSGGVQSSPIADGHQAYAVIARVNATKNLLATQIREKSNAILRDPSLDSDQRVEAVQDFGELEKRLAEIFEPFQGFANRFAVVMTKWEGR
jgi:hypothetical protein